MATDATTPDADVLEAALEPQEENRLHLFFDGETIDVGFTQLDIGDLSTDVQVKQALADHLNQPVEKFRNYQVDRQEDGNITVRPEAVFGQ